jgi:hypothetical protein
MVVRGLLDEYLIGAPTRGEGVADPFIALFRMAFLVVYHRHSLGHHFSLCISPKAAAHSRWASRNLIAWIADLHPPHTRGGPQSFNTVRPLP